MAFQPLVPVGGIAGLRFLDRTMITQQAAFDRGPEIARDVAYFQEKIGRVTSAADLVADRRLLKVALGAFGLDSEIDKKAFIRKILDEGTLEPRALANRLGDPAYAKLTDAFGFGSLAGRETGKAGFAAKITAAYKTRAFELAVGDADNNLRLALNFRREIVDLAAGEGASWFRVLGSKPLREVFEKAFNLPKQFGQIDIDQQRVVLADKTSALFGKDTLAVFKDPAAVQKLLDRFLARAQIASGSASTSSAASALTLLQSASGSSGLFNLLAAR